MTNAPRKAAFLFIFLTAALDILAFGILIPVLPKLVLEFEGGQMAAAARMTGIFAFAWAAMQFLFSPLLGALSDRFGRRPIILLSNLGLGVDYVLMAMAPSLEWLFVGRVISGITAANFAAASAYVADITPPEKRAHQFGLLGAAFGLGFVVGPALGGWLGGLDLRLPFWVAAGLTLLNTLYGFLILPESLPPESRARFEWSKANPIGSLKLLRSHAGLLGLAAATLFYNLAHESLPSVFVLYTDHRYGWGPSQVGLYLAAVGVCSTVISALLVGPIVRRLRERRTLILGFLFGITGFVAFALAPTGDWFWLGLPFIALWAIAGPAIQSLMSTHVAPDEQGRLQGALMCLRGITGMAAPLLFTQVFAASLSVQSGAAESALVAGAPYALAAGLLCLSLLIALITTRRFRA